MDCTFPCRTLKFFLDIQSFWAKKHNFSSKNRTCIVYRKYWSNNKTTFGFSNCELIHSKISWKTFYLFLFLKMIHKSQNLFLVQDHQVKTFQQKVCTIKRKETKNPLENRVYNFFQSVIHFIILLYYYIILYYYILQFLEKCNSFWPA